MAYPRRCVSETYLISGVFEVVLTLTLLCFRFFNQLALFILG